MIYTDYLQLALLIGLLTLLTKPLGIYLSLVLHPSGKTPLDFCLRPMEKAAYRLCGIDPAKEQNWKEYLFSLLTLSAVSLLATFFLLYFQKALPLNPENSQTLSLDLLWNTAVSFTTHTNWQSYSGDTTLSYFSQMGPLLLQNFLAPAVALSTAAALVRGIARHSHRTLGNFWVDITRISLYLLLPLSLVFALFFIWQGSPQNFQPSVAAQTLESGETQSIIQGPIACRVAIKVLGSNGGGYTHVNAAHPYENPTPLSNFVQILGMLLIPAAQTYYFGREIKNQKHGWTLYIVMALLFVGGVIATSYFEKASPPQQYQLHIAGGNLEGKETRFSLFGSSLYAVTTTATSTGAVNSSHSSYSPLSSIVLLLNMQLGEMIWGGVGSGLYSMLLFVIITLFTVGLIVGKSPEYLGNRIAATDIKISNLAIISFIACVLGFTAWACSTAWGTAGTSSSSAHGFSEILYAFTSTAANNGSSFASLNSNTPWYNYTLSVSMLFGRFAILSLIIALAGSLAKKKRLPFQEESFPITGFTFTLVLLGIIFLLGVLSFLPALVMGPFLEEFFLNLGVFF